MVAPLLAVVRASRGDRSQVAATTPAVVLVVAWRTRLFVAARTIAGPAVTAVPLTTASWQRSSLPKANPSVTAAGVNAPVVRGPEKDRKSTRLNSSHHSISYAVF